MTLTRKEVIQKLVRNAVVNLTNKDEMELLECFVDELYHKGFKGYDSFTNAELEKEYGHVFAETITIKER